MNTRMKLLVVLAGLSGLFLASAVGFAYAQSTAQSSQTSCGSMMNGHGSMGMMGGMSHYGSMSQDQCRAQMGQQTMGHCQNTTVPTMLTQRCSMMVDQ